MLKLPPFLALEVLWHLINWPLVFSSVKSPQSMLTCKYRSMMATHMYSISCSSLDLERPCTSQSTRMACMQPFYLSHLRSVGLWTTAPQAALDTGRYPSHSRCRAEGSPSPQYQYPQFCRARHQKMLGRGSLPSWRCPVVWEKDPASTGKAHV